MTGRLCTECNSTVETVTRPPEPRPSDSGPSIRASDLALLTVTVQVLLRVTEALAPVPEPETYALMLSGVGLVVWAVRRKRRRMPVAR